MRILNTIHDNMDIEAEFKGQNLINDVLFSDVVLDSKKVKDFLQCMRPVEPRSKVYSMIPKFHPKEKKVVKYALCKPKEPKFIPYEPYKAAVFPIMVDTFKQKIIDVKVSKNNYEIQKLAEQVSEMRRIEMNEIDKMVEENKCALRLKLKWEKEKEAYETDIKNLRESNSHLENQLKFQAQVNSELKTLLVAAVGEDLESRVQHLTEDKLALARALLNSANHLTSHQEQTEWLSGQCEVWRSKFLASSLMVEELAKWKSALSKGLNDLKCVTKSLLEEHHKVNTQSLKIYCYLKAIIEKVTGETTAITLKYRNIMEIMAANQELVDKLQTRFDVPDNAINQNYKDNKTIQPSVAERRAEKMLYSPLTNTNIQDALCSAVMGAANSMATHQQVFPNIQHCCAHCKGEIQDI